MSLVGQPGRVKVPQSLVTQVTVFTRSAHDVKTTERMDTSERFGSGIVPTGYDLAVTYDRLLEEGMHQTRAVWTMRQNGYVANCIDLEHALEALGVDTKMMHPSLALIEWALFGGQRDPESDPALAHKIRGEHRALEIWRQLGDRFRVGGESSLSCSVEDGIALRSAVSLLAYRSDLVQVNTWYPESKICVWQIGKNMKITEQVVGGDKRRPYACTVVVQVKTF